jgi:hypothetical protein
MQDDQLSTSYANQPNVDQLDPLQGVAEQEEYFGIDLPDADIIQQLDGKINDSRTYWNDQKGFNLRNRRERNARFLVGDQWHGIPLLQHHVPYMQNEIWVAENVTSAYATSRLPELESYPAQDTPESRGIAQDIAAVIRSHSDEHGLQEILCNIVLSMQNNYVGLIELEWDPNCGKFGDIKPRYIDPADVIIDKRARLGDNPAFICVTKQATSDELIAQFPKAKAEIEGRLGEKKGIITYRQVWCTYYADGKPQEGVVWYFDDVVLAKNKHPHWIYDEEAEGVSNVLPYPMKPFIPFNFVNDGSHWIDRAGPIDQAIPLQMMVNRIGKQIQEGIAHSSPVLIFNKNALDKPNADNITGQPWEKILVDADDVRSAYGVIQANQVPQFVVNEIERLKGLIHEIFGTPPQLRGESGNQTLGQDMMAREQAQGRQDLIVRALDRGLSMYFKYLLQMMKVYYTEDHYTSVLGDDGRYDFITINRSKIEDGIKVNVKAGSTLPFNKARMEKIAIDLANSNRISNLSLYEFLDIPNPGKHVERLVKEQVDAVSVVEDIKNDDQDRNATQDFEAIKAGELAPPRDDVDVRHIATHQKQLLSNEFVEQWTPEMQMALRDHIQTELDKMKMLQGITDEELYADQGMGQPPLPGDELATPPTGAPVAAPML